MNNRSRSTLFLIEQLIVVAVFAICASACIRIFTDAYFNANNSKDISSALLIAESGAESFKATSGDLGKVAQMLGGVTDNVNGSSAAVVYYDKQWRPCGESAAIYKLCLVSGGPDGRFAFLKSGELSVEKLTGEELIAFTVMARS